MVFSPTTEQKLLGNGKVILCNVRKVKNEHSFRCFSRFFNDRGTVYEQTVNLFVGIIQPVLEIARRVHKLINRPTRQLVRISALNRQIGIETLLHDIAVFTIVKIVKICIMELVHIEFYNTVLGSALAFANIRHSTTLTALIKPPPHAYCCSNDNYENWYNNLPKTF